MSTNKPFTRKVQDVGNGCLGVSLPAGARENEGIEKGDEMIVDYDDDEGTISFRSV